MHKIYLCHLIYGADLRPAILKVNLCLQVAKVRGLPGLTYLDKVSPSTCTPKPASPLPIYPSAHLSPALSIDQRLPAGSKCVCRQAAAIPGDML